jgi:hypothetical protein
VGKIVLEHDYINLQTCITEKKKISYKKILIHTDHKMYTGSAEAK